jgi:formylglycine-generating enzyme required for sulfatase activity
MLPGCKVWRLEETTNSIGMRFVLIPAGEFLMGSPADDEYSFGDDRPQHRVRITKAFYLGVCEVTQGQYEAVVGSCPWSGEQYVNEGADYAATYVSWEDAVAFCEKLSAKEGRTYRLPTEAEWEYACRAARTGRFWFGDDPSALGHYAWYCMNARGAGEEYAHQGVGRKKPNGWGLHDMHGNVWECCADWYGGDYYKESPVDDPTGTTWGMIRVETHGDWNHNPGPTLHSLRVDRGGGWNDNVGYCRAANRFGVWSADRSPSHGFRVARTP